MHSNLGGSWTDVTDNCNWYVTRHSSARIFINYDFKYPDGDYECTISIYYNGNLCVIYPLPQYVLEHYNISCTYFNVIGTTDAGTHSEILTNNNALTVILPLMYSEYTSYVGKQIRLTLTFTQK